MPNKSYHAGYDHFSPDPGECDKMSCRACGDDMDVKRNVNGPTGYAEAIGGGKHLHDSFSCPNAGEDWHNQLIALDKELNKTSSTRVAALIEVEIKEVKETRVCTRKASGWF
jgi:hypothetical protein